MPKPRSSVRRSLWAALDWSVARRAALALLWLLLLAGVVLGWSLGVPRLSSYAAAAADRGPASELAVVSSDSAAVDSRLPLLVVFRDLPKWLEGDSQFELERRVRREVGENPLDRDALVRARESLLASGWFESVAQVRRTSRERVDVIGTFAEPAALVRHGERDWLIDANGRLLPMSWDAGRGPALAVVVGVGFAPPSDAGETWPGNDLVAALGVLAVVDRQPWAKQVQAIDLGGFSRERSIKLLTDRGSVIRWGHAPGTERAAEVSAAMKLDFLDHHYRRYGHIDGGLAGELDITQDVAVLR